MPDTPLDGLRVIDLGRIWSGPLVTRLLGDFGAEVIKVESLAGRGVFSGPMSRQSRLLEEFPHLDPGERPWNRASMFNDLNRNKHSVVLDLSTPEGADLFLKLVRISDVVAENYTPRVMANFGLDYANLKTAREDIIMLSMPAFGMTGPYRTFPGYGNTIEPVAGLTHLTGYPGGPPYPLGMIAGDVLAALHGVSAVLTALWHRHATGSGQHIDLSQAEAQTSVIGETILGYAMNRKLLPRIGNQHPHMTPHGCYRCRGDDSWVTIAVSSDEEWRGLSEAIGHPAWTADSRFADQHGRLRCRDELDALMQAWTLGHDHYEVMHILQAAGVAAGPVLTGREVLDDPHLAARGFFVDIPHPDAGTHRYAGAPIRLSKTPATFRLPAPCLGEHNDYVLGELLGLSGEEIARLTADGITGNTPPEVVQEEA